MSIKILKTIFLSCVLAFSTLANAGLITNFTGEYDVNNWTQNLNSGSIDLSLAASEISLISGNSSFADFTDFTIVAVENGLVKFDWSYTTEDWGQQYDPFGVLFNGGYTQLTGVASSGTHSWDVSTGDVFGFRARTTDGIFGSSTTTISNFSSTMTSVPEPSTLAIFALSMMGLAARRFKKKA
jgi:hypothetical protein